eukprot:696968-Rhodomonas_salina.2
MKCVWNGHFCSCGWYHCTLAQYRTARSRPYVSTGQRVAGARTVRRTIGRETPRTCAAIGCDGTGLLASAGEVSIIGDKAKKKHEHTTMDSSLSITMYCTGTAGGSTRPTGFLMAGVRKRVGYDDAWLIRVRIGAAVGSCIVMTPTA